MIDRDVRPPVAGPARSTRHPVGDRWAGLVLGAALVAITLVNGLNYTFAVAVMPNLAGADDRTFVESMQRYNDNPVFALTYTVALVLIALAPVLLRRHSSRAALRWTIAALVLYVVVFAVTMGINVPLNYEIDQAGDRIADLAAARDQVEVPWVVSNVVRTVLSTAAVAVLARALFLHGRRGAASVAAPVGTTG
jgi:uncharacterized membrane protein